MQMAARISQRTDTGGRTNSQDRANSRKTAVRPKRMRLTLRETYAVRPVMSATLVCCTSVLPRWVPRPFALA